MSADQETMPTTEEQTSAMDATDTTTSGELEAPVESLGAGDSAPMPGSQPVAETPAIQVGTVIADDAEGEVSEDAAAFISNIMAGVDNVVLQDILTANSGPFLGQDYPNADEAPSQGQQSPEAQQEEPPFAVIGDPEEGEVLPNSVDLFTNPPSDQAPGHTYNMVARDRTPPMAIFLCYWRHFWDARKSEIPFISSLAPHLDDVHLWRPAARPEVIYPDEVTSHGDKQAIHWSRFGTTEAQAREVRKMTYLNGTNMDHHGVNQWAEIGSPDAKIYFPTPEIPAIPDIDQRYDWRATYTKHMPTYRHYQLRHNLAIANQNAIFWQSNPVIYSNHIKPFSSAFTSTVQCFNPNDGSSVALKPNPNAGRSIRLPKLESVCTLSASHDVLVMGSANAGIYGVKSLHTPADTPYLTGWVDPLCTDVSSFDKSANHVYTQLTRSSSSPVAVLSTNDTYVRGLDIATLKPTFSHFYPNPVNCAATSPDLRWRLLVYDDEIPCIVDADSGKPIHWLPGHQDHGFACAWAPDGYTIATAHQDGMTNIYDVRNPSTTLKQIPSELSCVRSLQFSELGAGPPTLLAAESADFVHIIDADTFSNKQTLRFWGDVAGAGMTKGGETIWVACADASYGGLLRFQRKRNGGQGWESEFPRIRPMRQEGERYARRDDEPLEGDLVEVADDDEDKLEDEGEDEYDKWRRETRSLYRSTVHELKKERKLPLLPPLAHETEKKKIWDEIIQAEMDAVLAGTDQTVQAGFHSGIALMDVAAQDQDTGPHSGGGDDSLEETRDRLRNEGEEKTRKWRDEREEEQWKARRRKVGDWIPWEEGRGRGQVQEDYYWTLERRRGDLLRDRDFEEFLI